MTVLMVSPPVTLYRFQCTDAPFQPHSSPVQLRDHQVHEWLILFEREVEHIWWKEWNTSKILFIISRHGLFVDIPITIACESGFIFIHRGNDGQDSVVVHVLPFGAIDYAVSVDSVTGCGRLTGRDTSGVQHALQDRHL